MCMGILRQPCLEKILRVVENLRPGSKRSRIQLKLFFIYFKNSFRNLRVYFWRHFKKVLSKIERSLLWKEPQQDPNWTKLRKSPTFDQKSPTYLCLEQIRFQYHGLLIFCGKNVNVTIQHVRDCLAIQHVCACKTLSLVSYIYAYITLSSIDICTI